MSSLAINRVVQAEYAHNYLGHQVIRRLPQTGQTIHAIHAPTGERIAKYLYDDFAGTSSLIREYVWAGDRLVGVCANGAMYYVGTDHIARPVFATDDTGTIVWKAQVPAVRRHPHIH